MPQNHSSRNSKSGKASKAAKAILHPRTTLASVKASHTHPAENEVGQTSEDSATSRTSAASLSRKGSSASISSNKAKPLPNTPSATASPRSSLSSLPIAAPAPSVLAPAINPDILSMKKQAMGRNKPTQQAVTQQDIPQYPTASSSQSASASIPEPDLAQSADAPSVGTSLSNNSDAVPYAIDDVAAEPRPATRAETTLPPTAVHEAVTEPASSAPMENVLPLDRQLLQPEAKTATPIVSDVSEVAISRKLDGDSAEGVASVVAESHPAPAHHSSEDAAVTPVEVIGDIEDEKPIEETESDRIVTPVAAPPPPTETGATAAAKVASFTPPELTRLQHNTFVSRPTDPSRAALRDLDTSVLPAPLRPIDRLRGTARSPRHVIIFGWMDAPIRLVAKYAQPYTVLFPDATVLIQLSDGKSYLAREDVRRKQLQRVISEISSATQITDAEAFKIVEGKDVGDSTVTLIDHKEALSSTSSEAGAEESPKPSGFVIHSFSDGGAGNLALFLDEMARRPAPSPRVHSLIMDSSPGKSNPSTGSFAFTMHLSNRPRLRAIVRALVYIGLYLLKIWTKITGQPQRGELMRRRLNSLKSWSWITAAHAFNSSTATSLDAKQTVYPPRMYMYTKADKLIPWKFVEEHANHLAELRKVAPGLKQMENEVERKTLLTSVEGKVEKAETAQGEEYKVELRRWDTPPHCSIGRSDFEGYWTAVMDFYINVLSRS